MYKRQAYGYWLCNCFSLVAYGVLIMSTLDIFMPGTFTNGNNVAATIGSSLILWLMLAVALLGTKTGALINVAGTVCKIIPVIVFVVALAAVFKTGVFLRGFWGPVSYTHLTDVLDCWFESGSMPFAQYHYLSLIHI